MLKKSIVIFFIMIFNVSTLYGQSVYNLQDYIGRSPKSTVSDAIDNLTSDLDKIPATQIVKINIPGGNYYLDRPINLRSNTIYKGDGKDVTVFYPKSMMPAFIAQSLTPGNSVVDSTYYPDAFGKLDGTVAPAPNTVFGLRVKPDSHLTITASPFSHGTGDGFGGVQQLTVSFYLDGPINPGFLFGAGDTYGADPLYVTADSKNYMVYFRTNDQNVNLSNIKQFTFPIGDASKPSRVSFSIDLKNRTVSAWVNRVSVACSNVVSKRAYVGVVPDSSWSDLTHPLYFLPNDIYPFQIGILSRNSVGTGSYPMVDRTYYGLRYDLGLPFQNDQNGNQVRDDGKSLTDLTQFYDFYPTMLACLYINKQPNGNYIRNVTYRTGPTSNIPYGTGFAYLTSTQGGNGATPVKNVTLQDLSVVQNGLYGDNILLGGIVNFTFKNGGSYGGFHGVGTLLQQACWKLTFDNLTLSSKGDALFLTDSIVNVRDVYFPFPNRRIALFSGCSLNMTDCYSEEIKNPVDAAIKIRFSSMYNAYAINNMYVDQEFSDNMNSFLYMESGQFSPATLRLDNLNIGRIPTNGSVIKLRGQSVVGTNYPSKIYGNGNVYWYQRTIQSFVDSTDQWTGNVINTTIPNSTTPSNSKYVLVTP